MHLAAVINSQWRRQGAPTTDAGGFRSLVVGGRSVVFSGRLDLCHGKVHTWCLLSAAVALAVLSIGLFEATRLTTHVLRSPCTILGSEVVDVGTCSMCEDGEMPVCEAHPIATARIAVTFSPAHTDRNITGWVWYCKGQPSMDPCDRRSRGPDMLGLARPHHASKGAVHCTVGEVFNYMQLHAIEGETRQCYYSSRDVTGEDVWFSLPTPGMVDHAWFEKHLEYPVLLALGGLILLSVLLGCLALEGAELWAAGLVN